MTVLLTNGSGFDAGWVIGADGAHSVVRKALAVGFPGVPLVERFLLADVHAALTGHAMPHPRGCAEPNFSPRSRCPATTCGG